MQNSNQKLDFKITKAPTNYFHLILFILGSTAVGIMIYLSFVSTIFYDEEPSLMVFSEVFSKKASLEWSFQKNKHQAGDLINVKVLLDSKQKKTEGVDILLKYDSQALAFLTIDGEKEDFSKKEEAVKVDPLKYLNVQESAFDIFPFLSIDEKQGIISFSALVKPLQKISGKVEVCTLNFKAVKSGETTLSFIFEKGETTESNVAFLGKDILGSVKDLNIFIE